MRKFFSKFFDGSGEEEAVLDPTDIYAGPSKNPYFEKEQFQATPKSGEAIFTHSEYQPLTLHVGIGNTINEVVQSPEMVTMVPQQIFDKSAENLGYDLKTALAAGPLTGTKFNISTESVSMEFNPVSQQIEGGDAQFVFTAEGSNFQAEIIEGEAVALIAGNVINYFQVVKIADNERLELNPVPQNQLAFILSAIGNNFPEDSNVKLKMGVVNQAFVVRHQLTRILPFFSGNINQGNWFVAAGGNTFNFGNSAEWTIAQESYNSIQNQPYSLACKEGFLWNAWTPDTTKPAEEYGAKVVDWSDLGIVYEMKTLSGEGKVEIYCTTNDPYLTFVFTGDCTPVISNFALPVVPKGIDGSDTNFSIRPVSGHEDYEVLLFASEAIEFEQTTLGPVTNWVVVPDGANPPSQPPFFNVVTKTEAAEKNLLVPDGKEIEEGFFYQQNLDEKGIGGANKIIIKPKNAHSTSPLILRVARVPGSGELLSDTITPAAVKTLLLENKNTIALGGTVNRTADSYTYEYVGTTLDNFDPTSTNEIFPLMTVLPTDAAHWQNPPSGTDTNALYTFTPEGRVHLVKRNVPFTFVLHPSKEEFFPTDDGGSVIPLIDKNGVTETQITNYIDQAVADINAFMENQGSYPPLNSYSGGKVGTMMATTVVFLDNVNTWNPQLATTASKNAVSDAIPFLKSWLTARVKNQYNYNETLSGVLFSAGFMSPDADFSNVLGQDWFFHYYYLVMMACLVDSLDTSWKDEYLRGSSGPQMKDAIKAIIETCSSAEGSQYFARMATYDQTRGWDWALGLQTAFGNGTNTESTAEDHGWVDAVRIWGLRTGDQEITELGQYMSERQARAAQAYWQVLSSTSIFNDPDFPGSVPKGVELPSEWPVVGIKWSTSFSRTNWFDPHVMTRIGIQTILYNPVSILNLFDSKWAKRIIENFYIGPGGDPDDASTWDLVKTLPKNDKFWILINTTLLARQNPSLAQKAYRTFIENSDWQVDTGNNTSMLLFLILYNQVLQDEEGDWSQGSFALSKNPYAFVPDVLTIQQQAQDFLTPDREFLKENTSADAKKVLVLYDFFFDNVEDWKSAEQMLNMMQPKLDKLSGEIPKGEIYDTLVNLAIASSAQIPFAQ